MFNIAEQNLNQIINVITVAIKMNSHSSDLTESFDSLNSLMIASVEETPPTNNCVQHADIKVWLVDFHEQIKATIAIDLQELITMVGVDSIHNLEFFTKVFVKSLKKEADSILNSFKHLNTSLHKITDSVVSPHLVLYNSLIGCKEQCPFCKEQCELTDEDHLIGDNPRPHYIEIHRPSCLGKFTYKKNKKLVLDVCTKAIESDTACFRNADTNGEYFPYKNYKDLYPNWLISNESPKTRPKYWEWFIATFNSEVVAWNNAAPTSVTNEGWNDITEEDAIDSLSQTYGLQTDHT